MRRKRIISAILLAALLLCGCAEQKTSADATEAVMEALEESTATVEMESEEESETEMKAETGEATTSGYVAYCSEKEQENLERSQEMVALAKEKVYDILQAYDSANMIEYSAPSTAEEIFTDKVIDEICDGDDIAKAAVTEAVDCFKNGDSLGDTFGKSVNAAVEAIPGVVQDQFIDRLVPGYLKTMMNLYNTLEENSNQQIDYAISKLQTGFDENTQILILLLSADTLSGAELKQIATVSNDIYCAVYELENVFQVEMAYDDWWLLSGILQGVADEYYRSSFLAEQYHAATETGADMTAEAFTGTADEVSNLRQELLFAFDDPEGFYVQYSWLLQMKENLTALEYFDYIKLQEDSTKNLALGVASEFLGDFGFLLDMFGATETGNDNVCVDVLYEYMDTCKQALQMHTGGIEELYDIFLEITAMNLEVVNVGDSSENDMRYAVYFYQQYYNMENGPSYEFYKDRIENDETTAEYTAYYRLLESTVGGQKALLSQAYLEESSYLADMESDLKWLNRGLYAETDIEGLYNYLWNDNVDISQELTDMHRAYANALQELAIGTSNLGDIYSESCYVNANGNDATLTIYRKKGYVAALDQTGVNDGVVAMKLEVGELNTEFTTFYSCADEQQERAAAYANDGRYIVFGRYLNGYCRSLDTNLSEDVQDTWSFYVGSAEFDSYNSDMQTAADDMSICLWETF